MAITMNLTPNNVDASASNFVYGIATLTFSGSYTNGMGDTLDFTQVADKISSSSVVQAFAESQNGNGAYFYVVQQGAALNSWKLRVFAVNGTELATGAYPGSVTGDVVQLTLTARKLL